MGRREGKIFQIISGTMMVASENYLCVQVLYSNEPYNVFKEFVWDPTEPVAMANPEYRTTSQII